MGGTPFVACSLHCTNVVHAEGRATRYGEGCVHVVSEMSVLEKLRKVEKWRNREISCINFFSQFIMDFVQCVEASLLEWKFSV